MSKKSLFTLLAILTLSMVVGCSNPADKAPDAEVKDPVQPTETATGGAEYVISGDSSVGFVGSKVTGSHDGGFKNVSGTISVVDGDPSKSIVSVNIDTGSIWSDNEKLTGHLKSADFFDVENFPISTFNSTSIEADGAGFKITGNLDLHGVTKSITFPATITVGADKVTATAEFSIKRFDFGIEYPGPSDNLIRDEVLIKFDLMADPA